MNSFGVNMRELLARYKEWVCRNPETASQVETLIKCFAYSAAGKMNKSIILTEAMYSFSHLLSFFNDWILYSQKVFSYVNYDKDKIKLWLTIINYLEILLEVSCKRLWGEKGKWIIIVFLQLLKCAGRLTLLLHCKEKIISYPALIPCSRSHDGISDNACCGGVEPIVLSRSQRKMRTVSSCSSLENRLWEPPTCVHFQDDKKISKQKRIGEMLYIIKPVLTLKAVMKYGQSSWKPWLVSAFTDVASLYLLDAKVGKGQGTLTPEQRLEISRRHLMLIMYLMRSPFYEKYVKDRLGSFLNKLSQTIPAAKFVCGPIQEFLSYRQETYLYLWSS